MRYIEVPGEIDRNNQLILHELLSQIKPQPVEIDIIFRDDEEDDREPTKEKILENICESLREYSSGERHPVSEMWNDIMIQTTGEINEEGQLVLDQPLIKTSPQYVDVVMWFIEDRELTKKIYESDENTDEEHIALVKECSESRTRSYAG